MSSGLVQQGYQVNTGHKILHTISPNLMEFKVIQDKLFRFFKDIWVMST